MSKSNLNQLIHKIIEYIPNEKVRFVKHEVTGNLQIIFTNKKVIITISEYNTWEEVKRYIDTKISNEKNEECLICSKNELQKKRITCIKCASEICVNCYISIFRENKGTIKCQLCNYIYGEVPEYMVEMSVQKILDSL
jgi:hypothetical protein